MMDRLLLRIRLCWLCWKLSGRLDDPKATVAYSDVSQYGVPRAAFLLATDRNAWRVSTFATKFFLEGGSA